MGCGLPWRSSQPGGIGEELQLDASLSGLRLPGLEPIGHTALLVVGALALELEIGLVQREELVHLKSFRTCVKSSSSAAPIVSRYTVPPR